MAASVAVCSGGILRTILEKKRLVVDDIEIQTKVDRNQNEVNKIEAIHIHFVITGKDLEEGPIEKAMTLVGKNCSMALSVKDCIEIKETFELKAKNK